MGRKSKYQPEYSTLLTEHMGLGYSFESFGGRIGVHKDTLYEWLKRFPDFSYAKDQGMAASLLWWEDLGRSHAQRNPAAWIFNMRSRFQWGVDREPENAQPITIVYKMAEKPKE